MPRFGVGESYKMFAIYFEGQIKTPGAMPCVQGQRLLELHIGFFLFVACAFDGADSRATKPVSSAGLHSTVRLRLLHF